MVAVDFLVEAAAGGGGGRNGLSHHNAIFASVAIISGGQVNHQISAGERDSLGDHQPVAELANRFTTHRFTS